MDAFKTWYERSQRMGSPIEMEEAFNAALALAVRMCEEKYAGHSPQSRERKAAEGLAHDIRAFMTLELDKP